MKVELKWKLYETGEEFSTVIELDREHLDGGLEDLLDSDIEVRIRQVHR